jgi:hypothetical protein
MDVLQHHLLQTFDLGRNQIARPTIASFSSNWRTVAVALDDVHIKAIE